ncbi:MAG: glycosyltransferase [Verrucomicrobia bacterium]|nr:glycosyltransferase [Verrucomicrobiota bacterium]
MKFSVITPCYNRRDYIAEAVDSVLAQGYADFEHWIIDAGSNDGTLEVLGRYPHLKVVSEPDRGVYDGMNKGLCRASGDVVVLLNSDDILTPGAFHLAAGLLGSTVGTMLVSGGCEIFRTTAAGREVVMHRYLNPRHYQLSLKNVTVGHPLINARFFRRKVFEQIGLFDLRYPIAADRDFLIRAALRGLPDAPVTRLLYRYRWHAGSLTMNAGNASLLQGMQDGLEIARHYLSAGRLAPADAAHFKQWRRESLANEVMIHAVNGALPTAVTTAMRSVAREPLTAVTLARLGTLAVYRRLRTWNRLRQAHDEA